MSKTVKRFKHLKYYINLIKSHNIRECVMKSSLFSSVALYTFSQERKKSICSWCRLSSFTPLVWYFFTLSFLFPPRFIQPQWFRHHKLFLVQIFSLYPPVLFWLNPKKKKLFLFLTWYFSFLRNSQTKILITVIKIYRWILVCFSVWDGHGIFNAKVYGVDEKKENSVF